MTVSRPIDVVFDPSTWRDPDAVMVGRRTDSPAWRVAAFQRLAALAWSQRAAADPGWARSWSFETGEAGERHWNGVIAGRQWLALPGGEAQLRGHLGDDVVDECWRAALASVALPEAGAFATGVADGPDAALFLDLSAVPEPEASIPERKASFPERSRGPGQWLARPRPVEDRGVVEAARRHLRLVAQAAGAAPPRVVRVYDGDVRSRVNVSGVPHVFAYLTVPAGARVRASGIDMPDGTRRVVEYDRLSGGFDRTQWAAT